MTSRRESWRLSNVEFYGVEDGFEALAHSFDLLRRNVAGAADFATAKGVDDEIESIARVIALSGVDLAVGFSTDSAVLVGAVGERDSVDGYRSGVLRLGGGLGAAFRLGGVRRDAEVKKSSAECRRGEWIEGHVSDGTHLGVAWSGARIEVEGAEVGVLGAEVPAGGNLKRDTVACVVEMMRGWCLRFGLS